MTVQVFTLPNCVQCDMTKKQLKHLAIDFTEYNLEEHPAIADEFRAAGMLQAPIVKAGNETWSGFRLQRIRDIRIKHQDE